MPANHAPSTKKEHRINGLLRVLTYVAFLVGTVMAILLIWVLAKEPTFQPFTYETTSVMVIEEDGSVHIPQVAGHAAPSVYASDAAVPFVMNRCNNSDKSFGITAYTDFVSDETGERWRFSEEGTKFDATPGCLQTRFTLEIPSRMLTYVDDQTNQRDEESSFHMEGEIDIEDGATAYWVSESFLVVDDDPVIPGD